MQRVSSTVGPITNQAPNTCKGYVVKKSNFSANDKWYPQLMQQDELIKFKHLYNLYLYSLVSITMYFSILETFSEMQIFITVNSLIATTYRQRPTPISDHLEKTVLFLR